MLQFPKQHECTRLWNKYKNVHMLIWVSSTFVWSVLEIWRKKGNKLHVYLNFLQSECDQSIFKGNYWCGESALCKEVT